MDAATTTITPSESLASETESPASYTTPPPTVAESGPIPTLSTTVRQDLWGWACNSTNNTRAQIFESISAPGCSETFLVPSSTKVSMNLTATVTGNSTEPTRTFSPEEASGLGAPQFSIDASWSGLALFMVLGTMVGFF